MTEEQANLPATRENLPERDRPNFGFESVHFYTRENAEEYPLVNQRPLKPHTQCKLCRMVPNLMQEKGYTFEQATDAERDMYRFVYTFWSGREIANWLRKTHDYDVHHGSVSRHISNHVPSPQTALIDRIQTYRPDYMHKQFFNHLADTMKLVGMKYQAQLVTGDTPISTGDFLAVAKTLREWQELLADLDEDKTDKIIQAIGETIEEVLGDHPDIYDRFTNRFRERLEELEQNGEE